MYDTKLKTDTVLVNSKGYDGGPFFSPDGQWICYRSDRKGDDLLKEVRASPEFSNTPFIMITAESKTENVIAAKKAGVSNYIVKPFNAATLKAKMEAVFPGAAA